MNTSKRSMNAKCLLWAMIGVVSLVSTAITLPGARGRLSPRSLNAREGSSRAEFSHGFASLPNHYLRLIQPNPVAIFTVTTTADNGSNAAPTPSSLREAIVNANNSGGGTINFNIPASDPNCNATTHVCTITIVTRPLPDITASVTIDGYTQPGASPNTLASGDNAVLLVELTRAP